MSVRPDQLVTRSDSIVLRLATDSRSGVDGDGATVRCTLHAEEWAGEYGLMEAARRLAVGLRRKGADLALATMPVPGHTTSRALPTELRGLPTEGPSPFHLWTTNLNLFEGVDDTVLTSYQTNQYNIATWYWELAELPAHFVRQLDRVDEIWVPTRFVYRSFRRHTSRPMQIVPPVVPRFDATAPRAELRERLAIPRDAVVFLVSFDYQSSIARKNPLAAVEAFARAFDPTQRGSAVQLVVKAHHLDKNPRMGVLVDDAVRAVDGLLLDEHMPAADFGDLMHACDVYVSLHRAEGFGLGLAEAMAIGKPTIATAYSGNLDFMTSANSCLVGYHLVPIHRGDHILNNDDLRRTYDEGLWWAEPDVDQAVEWMRLLARDPALRERLGARAASDIANIASESRVCDFAMARLRELHQQRWSADLGLQTGPDRREPPPVEHRPVATPVPNPPPPANSSPPLAAGVLLNGLWAPPGRLRPGIVVAGYLESSHGVGEASRSAVTVEGFFELAFGHPPDSAEVERLEALLPQRFVESPADAHRLLAAFDVQSYPTAFSVSASGDSLCRVELDGFVLWIDRDDPSVSAFIRHHRAWEQHVSDALTTALEPGSAFIDVGANVGFYSFQAATVVGPSGSVLAVEANAENCRLLELSKAENKAKNVVILPVALDRREGMVCLSSHIGTNGGLVPESNEQLLAGRGTLVYATTLDDIATAEVDVVKIDVEGAEFRVLEGGRKMIERERPTIVMEFSCEMAQRTSDVDPAEALQDVLDLGYRLLLLNRSGEPPTPIASAAALLAEWGDPLRIEDLLLQPLTRAGG
jgi:FkbM family methyltransferase